MKTELRNILADKSGAECALGCLEQNGITTLDLIEAASIPTDPDAWRATWLLNHSIGTDDSQLICHQAKLIEALPLANDSHQRELLRLLDTLSRYDEDIEGLLFEHCIKIWSDTLKIPSTRIRAFRLVMAFTEHYPELLKEIRPLTTEEYTADLSSGIRHSFSKLIAGKW